MTMEIRTTYDANPNDVAQTTFTPSMSEKWLPLLTLKRSGWTPYEPCETIVAYILFP